MAHVTINPSLLATLKDKVVVLTGGATGIGRSTVRLFHRAFPLSALLSLPSVFQLSHAKDSNPCFCINELTGL